MMPIPLPLILRPFLHFAGLGPSAECCTLPPVFGRASRQRAALTRGPAGKGPPYPGAGGQMFSQLMLMMRAFFGAAAKGLRLRESQLVRDILADAHDGRFLGASR